MERKPPFIPTNKIKLKSTVFKENLTHDKTYTVKSVIDCPLFDAFVVVLEEHPTTAFDTDYFFDPLLGEQ